MAANEVAALFFLLSTKLCRSFSFHLLLAMLRVLLLPPVVVLIEEQDDDDADDDVDATPRAIKTVFAILFASLSDSCLCVQRVVKRTRQMSLLERVKILDNSLSERSFSSLEKGVRIRTKNLGFKFLSLTQI